MHRGNGKLLFSGESRDAGWGHCLPITLIWRYYMTETRLESKPRSWLAGEKVLLLFQLTLQAWKYGRFLSWPEKMYYFFYLKTAFGWVFHYHTEGGLGRPVFMPHDLEKVGTRLTSHKSAMVLKLFTQDFCASIDYSILLKRTGKSNISIIVLPSWVISK